MIFGSSKPPVGRTSPYGTRVSAYSRKCRFINWIREMWIRISSRKAWKIAIRPGVFREVSSCMMAGGVAHGTVCTFEYITFAQLSIGRSRSLQPGTVLGLCSTRTAIRTIAPCRIVRVGLRGEGRLSRKWAVWQCVPLDLHQVAQDRSKPRSAPCSASRGASLRYASRSSPYPRTADAKSAPSPLPVCPHAVGIPHPERRETDCLVYPLLADAFHADR